MDFWETDTGLPVKDKFPHLTWYSFRLTVKSNLLIKELMSQKNWKMTGNLSKDSKVKGESHNAFAFKCRIELIVSENKELL